jgi:regulator of sigma E protease
MGVVFLIIGIVLFIGLVVVHELGHFLVARRNGVEAEEFGIFFPPKIWSRKIKGKEGKKGFIFSINLLPLGGFVRLKGEHDADIGPGSFGAASLWAKTKIMLAGVGVNFVVALILFTILAWVGMPQLIDNQFTVGSDTKVVKSEVLVGDVLSGSPADKAGLQSRDQLLAIAPASQPQKVRNLSNANKLPDITKQLAGQKVMLTFARNGQTHHATATLLSKQTVTTSLKTNHPKGYLGITSSEYKLQRSTWSAPVVAIGLSKQITVLTFKGLGTAIKGLGSTIAGLATSNKTAREAGQTQASDQVSGPVGIFVILKDGSELGFQLMLMIVAVISLTLAIMNILPIPALDGGRLFVTYIARLLRKRVSKQVEDLVYGTSFALLLGLIALVTVVDVKRFF